MSTGIIRRIDELGRIVIPKEIRKNLRIKNGDNLEVIVEDDSIILKKFSEIENISNIASIYADSFYQVLKYNVIVTDCDKVVACSGNLKIKYLDRNISDEILMMIERRDNFVSNKKKEICICNDTVLNCYYAFSSIIHNGDSIGSVIILSLDSPMLEQDIKLASILANIMSNYFV